MKHLYEVDMHDINSRIDNVYGAVSGRLLPAFASIEQEADLIEKQKLDELSRNFHPDSMDDAEVYDRAFHEGVDHYLIQTDMRNEFIKSTLTWLFHLFEKDCTYVFETEDGNIKKAALQQLSINTGIGSDWHKCNKEMRVLANAIKHGQGDSFTKLEILRPDLFANNISAISDNNIILSEHELLAYVDAMKSFWSSLFNKLG